jgi:microcompartment protein CcmL/EutN
MSSVLHPALGLLELSSIACGVLAGDAMAKRAPVAVLRAGTVHPGKFVVLVGGDVASVEEALAAGREVAGGVIVDELFLAEVHGAVVEAVAGRRGFGEEDAVGIVETATVAAAVGAADRGVKAAWVELAELRLADDLGGKAYCVFAGTVGDVEAAVERAVGGMKAGRLVASVIVPRLHGEMRANLAGSGFLARHLSDLRGAV